MQVVRDRPVETRPQIISVDRLSMVYPSRSGPVTALDDIRFDIGNGDFVSIVGPSGCGKSTLLRILCGLLSATSGSASLRGEAIAGPSRDVGVVFQAPVLFPWRSVLRNVMLPVDVQRRDRDDAAARARELLATVGLAGFEDRYPWELSGGMQQRVSIARALINDPAILLMDEPFGALDAMTREQLNEELQRVWLERNKTVLFITHSIPEAVFLSDRVLVMTPRPGRLADDVRVDLPRPRSLEVMTTPEFGAAVKRIRHCFSSRGGLDA